MRRRRYEGPADLLAMQRAVQRTWTPGSHWHIGDLAWQSTAMDGREVALWSAGDGPAGGEVAAGGHVAADADGLASRNGSASRNDASRNDASRNDAGRNDAGRDEAGQDEVVGWAWVEGGRHLGWHAPESLIGEVLDWFDEVADAGGRTISGMESDAGLLAAGGYRPVEAPYFRHCVRDLTSGLPGPQLPHGYRARAVWDGEEAERAAAHRAAWRPETIGRLQVPPVALTGESGMTTERYRQVMGTWPYRHALDLVVEAPDGAFVASALGWYDEVNRSALLEPVGTDAGHSRRGFGAAVSLACLHAMREAGATLAVVCPRGDQAYPVPRVLYHRLGFRDAGRTVTYAD